MSQSIGEQRREMLEQLKGISLRGFPELYVAISFVVAVVPTMFSRDATPSSVATSLPTPHNEAHLLGSQGVVSSECVTDRCRHHRPTNDHCSAEIFTPYDSTITAPAAPMMKDYDSFTEGTAKGSFDSIPAGSTNEYGDDITAVSIPSLFALPSKEEVYRSPGGIETWRSNVAFNTDKVDLGLLNTDDDEPASSDADTAEARDAVSVQRPVTPTGKRPRSTATDDDEGQRRTRIRAQSSTSILSTSMGTISSTQHGIGFCRYHPYPVIDSRPALVPPRPHSAPPR